MKAFNSLNSEFYGLLQNYLSYEDTLCFVMQHVRCCPADCAIKSGWEEELHKEMEFFETDEFHEVNTILKVLGHPSRLQIMMLLLNRDHCVCELIYRDFR